MFEPAAKSGSTPPTRAEAHRAPVAARRAMRAAVLCWAIAAGAETLAAQRAPKGGAESTAPPGALGDSSTREVARAIEQLAPLDEALRDVHGLTQPQSDSLAALEQRYARVFASLAGSARTLIDDASAAGLAPNVAELRSLYETVWSVRIAELHSARAMLATRAQRSRFDANVVKIQCEEAQLVEDVWLRTAGPLDGKVKT